MTKAAKRLQKARNNPNGWHFEDLKSLYEAFGFQVRSGKGSHHVASHPALNRRLTFIRHSSELPPAYVKNAVAAIDELLRLTGENDESK